MNKKELTYKDITTINSFCLLENEPFQVLDNNRIESALGNQFQPYPRKELAIASMYKSLVINHGFLNGNKRTAVIALYVASKIAGNELNVSDQDLAALTYRIAGENGSKVPVEEIAYIVFGRHETTNGVCNTNDIEVFAKDYISHHQWLMNELAK